MKSLQWRRFYSVIVVCVWAAAILAVPTSVVHLVADDLGSRMETRRTHNTDKMVANGIRLLLYHTHKVCSPARASLITGRYAWEVGYYEMQGSHAVLLNNVYRCF